MMHTQISSNVVIQELIILERCVINLTNERKIILGLSFINQINRASANKWKYYSQTFIKHVADLILYTKHTEVLLLAFFYSGFDATVKIFDRMQNKIFDKKLFNLSKA